MVDAIGTVDEITPTGESGINGNSSVGCVERTNAPRTTNHHPSHRWCHLLLRVDTVHSITHKKCSLAPEGQFGAVTVERLVNWKRWGFSSLDLLDAQTEIDQTLRMWVKTLNPSWSGPSPYHNLRALKVSTGITGQCPDKPLHQETAMQNHQNIKKELSVNPCCVWNWCFSALRHMRVQVGSFCVVVVVVCCVLSLSLLCGCGCGSGGRGGCVCVRCGVS